MTELIYLTQEALKLHPRNIRLYYPPQDVEEMARSLQATAKRQPSGNIHAILVVPADDESYYVVDGNLRLAAARKLGQAAPPFKCEVIQADQAEQLLLMAATGLHYPKDPVSEGRHYRRLIEEEGFTQAAIAAQTGLSATTISHRLTLLDLDEEIQQLIIERKLPADIRLIRTLRDMPSREQAVQIARYYAKRDVAIGSMLRRIRALAQRAHQVNGSSEDYQKEQNRRKARTQAATAARTGRAALDEPARVELGRLAREFICEGCRIEGLGTGCYMCPGPQEFIEHLFELSESSQVKAELLEAV